jgi:hypothetical protein
MSEAQCIYLCYSRYSDGTALQQFARKVELLDCRH